MAESSRLPRTGHGSWPGIPFGAWTDTRETLHMMTQIAGKIRMALTPLTNHWWNVVLYVSARGLTTTVVHCGDTGFELEFDFLDHVFRIRTSRGDRREIPLAGRTVAGFYREVMEALLSVGIEVRINTLPCEVPDPVPFETDMRGSTYDPEYAQRFWQVLLRVDRVYSIFRSRYLGKVSPVHFFWGSFDLAVSRFSGRAAPPHPGSSNVALSVMREAYSHEVSSTGFWPGTGFGEPAFYTYAYPEPPGFREYPVRPAAARYHPDFGEFLLPYEAVRNAPDPDGALLEFLQTTYEAAAVSGGWDRKALERP